MAALDTNNNLPALSNGQLSEGLSRYGSDYSNFASAPAAGGTNLLTAIRRRWLPAIAVGVTVFAGVAAHTFTRTPTYKSELLILAANKPPVSVAPDQQGASNSSEEKDLSVDIQILRSRPLVGRALQNLDGAYDNLSVGQVMGNLSIRPDSNGNVLTVSYTDTVPERAQAVLEALGPTYVAYSLESRRSQATNAIKFIESQLPGAKKALNSTSSDISNFRKTYNFVDPNDYAESVSSGQQSLQQQISEAELALNLTRRQYQELQRQMGQVGQNTATAVTDSVLSQDATYQDLVNQLRQIEAQYAMESLRFQDSYPGLQALKAQRDEVRRLLQQQTQRVIGGKASQAANKTSTSGALAQELSQQLLQLQTNLATQTTQLSGLRQAEAAASSQFKQIPALQQQYAELQRQYNLNSATVDSFLEQLRSLRIVEAQETTPWKILEAPYLPSQPISPNIRQGLMMGLLAGTLLGLGIALLLERLDQRIKEVEEIKALLDLPLLGAIPKANVKDLAASYGDSYLSRNFNSFTESIRSLALNLPHFRSTQGGKIFALTSSIPGEGKTTVTYNLGLALAELGKRVLIVDADLHNPSIHVVSQLPNVVGLSTAIATDQPWQRLIHSSPFKDAEMNLPVPKNELPQLVSSVNSDGTLSLNNPSLPHAYGKQVVQTRSIVGQRPDILTAGPSPLNPIAWLSSARMTELLEEWTQAYDYVLIDTPPVVGVADAQSLAARVDGMILVVGVDQATRSAVTRAMELLMGTRCNLPGMVVNLIEHDRSGYGHPSGYGSYYGKARPDQDLDTTNI